jgi:glycosyltransferase involved in cell wall biosynthesis
LVDEFSLIDDEDFFLLILGQIEEYSIPIIKQAESKLAKGTYLIKQVASVEVRNYLALADYFILPSLSEGLPRVLPEALSFGLLPIVHDYQVTREALKGFGFFKDLTQTGRLKDAIDEVDRKAISKTTLINFAYDNYSWVQLSQEYEAMIVKNIS